MRVKFWKPFIGFYLCFGLVFILFGAGFTLLFRSQAERHLFTAVYVMLGILYFLSLLLIIGIYYWLYKPLHKVTEAAKSYADGDFSVKLTSTKDSELGQLMNAMGYMADSLDSLEHHQRKFISNVSHDFRSPLTSIKGFVEAMADGTIPPEAQEKYFNIILFETGRLEKLTDNLLELNKYGTKKQLLNITSFDLNRLIRRATEIFEGNCLKKNITLELNLYSEPILVSADEDKIDQVIHNLIDNAIKFSSNYSKVSVSTRIQNGKCFISVKDSGIGIPKDSINKIWERFYKTDTSRGKDKRGTGLGLSIVKEIIHAHNENINVISTEDVGTEFIFSLPLA